MGWAPLLSPTPLWGSGPRLCPTHWLRLAHFMRTWAHTPECEMVAPLSGSLVLVCGGVGAGKMGFPWMGSGKCIHS